MCSYLTPLDPSQFDELGRGIDWKDGNLYLSQLFVPVCSSPEWDYVEPEIKEELYRKKNDGEFWYFPTDPFVYQAFSLCLL